MRLENRIAPRRNVSISATVVFDSGRRLVPCIIRNLSDSGAKIEMQAVVGIPNTFDLFSRGMKTRSCRVVWRALKEMGVEFTN